MGIVTNGLVGYWHYQQGINGSTWDNISPNTEGNYNGQIAGAVLNSNGLYFDGIDDYVQVPKINKTDLGNIVEMEMIVNLPLNAPTDVSKTLFGTVDIDMQTFSQKAFFGAIGGQGTSVALIDQQFTVPAFPKNTTMQLNINLNKNTGESSFYLNGNLLKTHINKNARLILLTPSDTIIRFFQYYSTMVTPNADSLLKGTLISAKMYNKVLTSSERTQNINNGVEIGLGSTPVSPPKVTITNQNKYVISQKDGFSFSTVTFKFDKDITEWKIKLLGTSHDTGTLINFGSATLDNSEIEAIIDYNDLLQEGQYRFNIYGKDSDGNWTPYES
jgi:hypothetical protein